MNAAPVLVALAVAAVAWAIGGSLSGLLFKVAPVSLACLMAATFLWPQRLPGESFAEARVRVRRSLWSDPLTWIALGLVVLLLIPLANVGLCWQCDAAQIAAGADPAPPVAWLPSCLNRREHLPVPVWFLLALSVMLAVRHGLMFEGRHRFLDLLVWNSVALAVLGFLQRAAHAPGPLGLSIGGALPTWKFFSAFGYANFAAAYFTAMLCVALALWAGDVAEGRRFGIPVRAFVLYCAALGTLSRTAIVFAPLAAAAGAVFACVVLVRRIRAGMRGGHWRFLVVAGAVAACAAAFELDGVRGEVAALEPSAVSQRMVDRAQYRRRAAIGLWKDNKLFGCGGLGYMHLCTTKMTAEELKSQEMEGGAFVHNDYLQFLCEHGAVGFGLMVVLLVALLRPLWGGWRRSPAAVFVALGVFAVLLHALWDCPLRCPSVLMTLFGLLAAGRAGEMV
ncbi:MAG: O-antigen ligase family protein [bacterium]|nr:O-antigen ligase family protein [Candidatus Colisoma equi]